MARFLRIYPPLVLSVLVTIGCVGIINGFGLYGSESYLLPGDLGSARERAGLDWSSVLTTLSLTYQLIPGHDFILFNGPLWSLSFEVWLYVLAGLGAYVWSRGSALACLAAAALVYAMYVVSEAKYPPFWTVSIVWGLGFLYSWSDEDQKAKLAKNRQKIIVAAAVACLALANVDLAAFLTGPYSGLRQHLFYVCFSVIIFSGMGFMLRRRQFEGTLVCRCLAWAATFSYTLYLIHFPLFLLSLSLFRPSLLPFGIFGAVALAALSLAAVVILSWAMASLVEDRHLLRSMGRAFWRSASRSAVPAE